MSAPSSLAANQPRASCSSGARFTTYFGLGARLWGGRIRRRLEQERTLCDPEIFRRLKRYELMLFRVPGGRPE